jgi:hypothetical protein
VPDTTTDSKGRMVIDRANPNAAGLIVRYSADLSKALGVTRFDWGVAGIETGLVAPDGSLLVAGRATEAFRPLAQAAACVITPQPAEEPGGKGKPRFGPTEYQGVTVPGDVFVAKLSPDADRLVWVHILAGHRTPPRKLFLDPKGDVVFECVGIKRISADGKMLAAVTGPMGDGDRVKLLAVSPTDGAMLYGGDRNTRTNREPWRQPFLYYLKPDGEREWKIWDWDSKIVGSDAKKLESDSAVKEAVFCGNGDILVGGWSDGGNSVYTRQIKDLDAKFEAPGFGMSAWGMKGANSLAYLMRFDPKTLQFRAWSLWVSYVPQSPDDPKKGGNPNFANIRHMLMLPDGSVGFAGQAATGLVQTPGAWFEYAPGQGSGGHYVAVFNADLTDLQFSSYVPGCEIGGIGLAKSGLVVASRAEEKGEKGGAPPLLKGAQEKFGGGRDGHLVLIEVPAAK